MNLLIKKVTKILPISLIAVFLLAAGHFCLQNVSHVETDHSHTTSVMENDTIEECCQGNNSLSANSFIIQKPHSQTLDVSFANITYTYTSPAMYNSGQSLALPNISPHHFIRKTARILLS